MDISYAVNGHIRLIRQAKKNNIDNKGTSHCSLVQGLVSGWIQNEDFTGNKDDMKIKRGYEMRISLEMKIK